MEKVTMLWFILNILKFAVALFVGQSQPQLIGCLESDRKALIDFKIGLEDSKKRLSSWKGSNCCQWQGVSCDNNTGAVMAVNLRNPTHPQGFDSSIRYDFWSLSGEIRPSLSKLKSLRHLDLSGNKFSETIPAFFGSLENLQYLNLSSAGFSGEVPPSLGNLTNLQFLDVSDLGLVVDDLEWVTGLVSLKHLIMSRVDLSMVGSNWVRILNKLPSLTELHLSSCSLFGSIPSLKFINLTSLAVLDLSFNTFDSKLPDWILNISSLVTIDISFSGLYGRIPLGFSELPNLKSLNLAGNDNLTASCAQLFRGRWEKIEILDLALNKIHGKLPASIGNMTFLSYFNLFVNNVEGGIPSSIGQLCNLKSFRLSGNNLTGTLPKNLEGSRECLSSSTPLPSLQELEVSNNRLVGILPEWLGQLQNLVELSLDYNSLSGPIPASLGLLQNLSKLGLGGNKLNGTLPESLGQLSELSVLDVSSNNFIGTITENHFLKLGKLRILHLSSNSFILNVSSNWYPPFQIGNLDMRSCHLGPSFPGWLKTQKEVKYLDFSNTSLSGSIPNWFWEISSNMSLLNVSFNMLGGQLPSPLHVAPYADVDFSSNLLDGAIPLPVVGVELLDLSNNHFSGHIPKNFSYAMPYLIFLSLSSNHLSGKIPASIGFMNSLLVIDLSNNSLTGSVPSSIGNCTYLKALDLSKNNISGNIPASLGQLILLQTLHLSNNKLSGQLPSSFQNLSSLEMLDLGNNRLTGELPGWFGEGFERLKILNLRLNSIFGELSSGLSNLSSIQVLDLAENNLNGTIPASFGNFKAMTQVQDMNHYLFYGMYRGAYYKDSLVVNTKARQERFTKTLSMVISLDLSGNDLSGELRGEITNLLGLGVLNLSRNHISGEIPKSISNLKQLASLDLSSNRLSGPIPQSLSALSFLGYLNLSSNELSGKIPYTDHMTTFDAASFTGNPGLCGAPIEVKCQGDDDSDGKDKSFQHDDDDGFIDGWFYMNVGLGFAAGIFVPGVILVLRTSWRNAYFGLLDKFVDSIGWPVHRTKVHRKTMGGGQRG